jgi:hypothetical protein
VQHLLGLSNGGDVVVMIVDHRKVTKLLRLKIAAYQARSSAVERKWRIPRPVDARLLRSTWILGKVLQGSGFPSHTKKMTYDSKHPFPHLDVKWFIYRRNRWVRVLGWRFALSNAHHHRRESIPIHRIISEDFLIFDKELLYGPGPLVARQTRNEMSAASPQVIW